MMKFTPIVISHISYLQNCTVYAKAYSHVIGTEKGGSVFIENPYSEFHVYSVEWTPEQIDFLLDGEVYQQFKVQICLPRYPAPQYTRSSTHSEN
ncbi:MAG TPA: family 16 glycosylhydrolase [Pricia sp.]|nr:family 16 glycosylhydrolase [Pricia sp.]